MLRYVILPWLAGLSVLLMVVTTTTFISGQPGPPPMVCMGGDNPDWVAPAYVNGEEIQTKVERMPVFPGCDDNPLCTERKLNRFVLEHLNLTNEQQSQRHLLQKTAWLTFVVRPDGRSTDIEVKQDPGYGYGAATAAALEKLNAHDLRWTPGREAGAVVPVQLTLRLFLGGRRCGN